VFESLSNKEETLTNTAGKYPASTAAYAEFTDVNKMLPAYRYGQRVLADSGILGDVSQLTKMYIENLKLLYNTVFLWSGDAGIKTRTSGANTFATKLYDMSAGNRDAAQATEANQPFIGGGIAPSEKRKLKANKYNGTNTKRITHSNIVVGGGNPFTVIYVLKVNKSEYSAQIIDGGLVTYGLRLGVASPILQTNSLLPSNKTVILEFRSDGAGGVLKINNVSVPLSSYNGANSVTLSNLIEDNSGAFQFDGDIYHKQILNKALSESESQNLYNYLRSQYPEIEGIDIGNQHWATSNYEGVVTANGTVIPEVQGAAAWADLTTPAWCYYNNDPLNGAVYGKGYNLYAAQAINLNAPQGYTIGTYAQWLQMVTLLGGVSVAGNKMKLNGTALWAVGNAGTNESGFTALPNGQRNTDGTFSEINNKANFWTTDGYLVTLDYNAATVTFTSGADAKIGAAVRLIRNSPVGENERIIVVSTTANISATPLSIAIPFGYAVEAIRIENKQSDVNLTYVSATHNNTAGTSLGTLITGKTVTAATSQLFHCAMLDMPSQFTDGSVRILATGNAGAGLTATVILKKMAL
jgi:uncharacterized protein (TIGR02145 family)